MTAAKTHIALVVKDVAKSTDFYSKLFGAQPHKERRGYANFDIESPGLKLALLEGKAGEPGTLSHLGILVADRKDVALARERLQAAGLETEDEEDVVCCHARQDKVWVKDPDGHAWEIYTILDDAAEEEVGTDACCDSMCCVK